MLEPFTQAFSKVNICEHSTRIRGHHETKGNSTVYPLYPHFTTQVLLLVQEPRQDPTVDSSPVSLSFASLSYIKSPSCLFVGCF
jgi:hypothetical protein